VIVRTHDRLKGIVNQDWPGFRQLPRERLAPPAWLRPAERPEAEPAQNRGEKGWPSAGVAPCRHQQGRDRPPVADRPNLGSPYSGLTYFLEKYGPAATLRWLTERTRRTRRARVFALLPLGCLWPAGGEGKVERRSR
jgi:hypothetical protein